MNAQNICSSEHFVVFKLTQINIKKFPLYKEMIEFYITATGNYDPQQIENPSSAFILDYKNKTLSVKGQYDFDF